VPYTVKVIRVDGGDVELAVTPEQPDAEPFALDHGFAVGLLLSAAHRLRWDEANDRNIREPAGPLGRELDPESIDVLAVGGGQPERFVSRVRVTHVAPWPWHYGDSEPTATYCIGVTDPRWLAHLEAGRTYVSYAYSEVGPFYA
jgi:hypothetical protein